MWSIIDKENVGKFIDKYPELEEDFDIFKLHENTKSIFLPRFFYKNYPSNYIKAFNPPYEPQKISVNIDIELRPAQKKLMKRLSDIYQTEGSLNGIIKMPPGGGKTASTIYLAHKLGLKTLIVVDKDSLFKQWVKEIVNFTKIDPTQIGVIKKDTFQTDNKLFVIATVQTLLSKIKKDSKTIYEKMKTAQFGFVAFDEVHNTSASEQYAKASIIMSAPNVIGLSATPFKYGSQDILMKNVIGEILFDEAEYQLLPEICFHFYKSGLDKYRFVLSKMGFSGMKAFYNKIIINSPTYLDLIARITSEDTKAGYRSIIICWTEKQIQAICERLDEYGITYNQFYGKSREFSRDDVVLVATYAYAGTGKIKAC